MLGLGRDSSEIYRAGSVSYKNKKKEQTVTFVCKVLHSLRVPLILQRAYKDGILDHEETDIMSGPWTTHSITSSIGYRSKCESVSN
jgi:hypothetical protein